MGPLAHESVKSLVSNNQESHLIDKKQYCFCVYITQNYLNFYWLFKNMRDFPGGPVVKNPPSYAGDVDSIPDQGNKITHAVGKLSLCATNS